MKCKSETQEVDFPIGKALVYKELTSELNKVTQGEKNIYREGKREKKIVFGSSRALDMCQWYLTTILWCKY